VKDVILNRSNGQPGNWQLCPDREEVNQTGSLLVLKIPE